MNTMRINLHIRDDVSPRLFAALASLRGRARAEFLRNLAERGLQPTLPHAPSHVVDASRMHPTTDPGATATARESLGDAFLDAVDVISGMSDGHDE